MKYGFIGCGNMGGAIAKALSRATKEIMVSDRSGKAKAFAEELGIVYSDAETVAARCDRIFIAVKPHMVQEVLSPLQKVLGKRKPLLITMAAGMEIAGGVMAVVRVASRYDDPVGPRGESFEYKHEIDAPGARKTHDLDIGRVFHAAGTRQVGPGVGTPVAHESYDLGLELCIILFFHLLSFIRSGRKAPVRTFLRW